jgi:hypothetical protein
MRKTFLLSFILLVILIVGTAATEAQNAPTQLNTALADLSARLGRGVTVNDITSWTFEIQVFNDTALGCSIVSGGASANPIQAYLFTIVYNGVTYDYRVSVDGSLVFPCDRTLLAGGNTGRTPAALGPCPPGYTGYLPPRLQIGGKGQVIAGNDPNRVRDTPSVNGVQTGVIQPGRTFDVLNGPSCDGTGIIWWQVAVDNLIGWTAEGLMPSTYFVEPLGGPGVVPTLAPPSGAGSSSLPATVPTMAAVSGNALAIFSGGSSTPIPGAQTPVGMTYTGSPVQTLAWSPDGQHLAYVLYDANFGLHLYLTDARGSQPIEITGGNIATLMPPSFTPDSTQLVYTVNDMTRTDDQGNPLTVVYTQGLTPGAAKQELAHFNFGVGCGGGITYPDLQAYVDETGYEGNPMILQISAYGLVHTTTCLGTGVALYNWQTGQDTPLGTNLAHAVLSPDRTKLAALNGEQPGSSPQSPVIVDLANGNVIQLTTAAVPDQIIWNSNTDLYYSTRQGLGQDNQQHQVSGTGGMQLSNLSVGIHHLDLSTSTDTPIYQGTAFGIGRMFISGGMLFFSQVAELDAQTRAAMDAAMQGQGQMPSVLPSSLVTLYSLPLNGGAASVVAQGIRQATPSPAALAG